MTRLLTTLLATGALALGTTSALAHDSLSDLPGVIHVTASATADAVPDRASVMAGVQTDGKTAQEAMVKNSELMRRVFAALAAQGIPERNISTSYLNLNPQYNYEQRSEGQPRLIGYRASNQITVFTRDLDATGQLIDALLQAGVNNINNVQFTVSEPDAAQSQARQKAIAKAQMKARTMAQAANVKLGRLLSMREGSVSGPVPYNQMLSNSVRMEAMDAAPPLAPGQREINATVTLSYAIDD